MNNLPDKTFYDILSYLEPKNLLSLYLTDNTIKNHLDSKEFLNILYNQYDIEANDFTLWIKKYNEIQNYYNPQLYLYQLENTVSLPDKEYINNCDNDIRLKCIDYMKIFGEKSEFSINRFGLAVNLMDCYCSKNNYDNMLLVGLACYKLTSIMDDYDIDDYDYISKIKKISISPFKIFDQDEFITMTKIVIKFLDGILIRPSTILYCKNQNEKQLATLSYYSIDLIIYKPSMIYECINYLLTGQYNIYALEELMSICHIVINTIKMLSESAYTIASLARNSLNDIKYTCHDNNTTYKFKQYQYNEPWHMGKYQNEYKIGEGGYGTVKKIKRIACGKNYAVKKLENLESSFVEISSLKLLNSEYIINLCSFNYKNHIHLYLPYYPDNLKNTLLSPSKKYYKQLMMGLAHCHYNDIIHRDIKPENILYDPLYDTLKLIDFGISVPYASKRTILNPFMAGTLWYMAPEALLGSDHYNYKVDIWAMGLVIVSMLNKGKAFFTGDSEIDQLHKIFMVLGTPNENTWPGVTSLIDWRETFPRWKEQPLRYFINSNPNDMKIIEMCLVMDPNKRSNTQDILEFIDTM